MTKQYVRKFEVKICKCDCEEFHYHKAAEAATESFNRWYKEFGDQW